ncbi:hypothetical protein PPACK8108_LOCUS4570, partial [Phakopsora pachyrhizi]
PNIFPAVKEIFILKGQQSLSWILLLITIRIILSSIVLVDALWIIIISLWGNNWLLKNRILLWRVHLNIFFPRWMIHRLWIIQILLHY